jgi:hypothetical protein
LDCSQCHTADGWSPAKFDHNLSIFKLEGQHTEAACESCHVNRQFKGTPMDCYSCHQQDDEHAGQYGTDCAACHNPSSWDNVDFDHNRSNFPLTGGHAGVACERCHASGQFAGLTLHASCASDPATMQVCLALIVLDATRQITGLQNIMVRTPALRTRVGEVLIMAVHPAVIVIHKRCTLRPAPSVMRAIILVMGVEEGAKVEEIDL